MDGDAPADLAARLEIALKFLGVSEPSREIAADELAPASFATFGLDPPAEVVLLKGLGAERATSRGHDGPELYESAALLKFLLAD